MFWTRQTQAHILPALLVTLVIAIVHCAIVRGSELAVGVSTLFDLGAKNTPPALAAAKSQYEKLKRVDPNDRRIDYAYGVVLANQHRYHDALPHLSRSLEGGKGDLNAYRAKIWAQVQDRRYADALDDMVTLSQRFPRDLSADPDAQYLEAARFMGTVFGYLELTRPGAVESELKSKHKTAVLVRIGEGYTAAFDEGRNAVAAGLAELQAERKKTQEQMAAVAGERHERDKTVLEDDRGKIAVQLEAMQTSAEHLRDAERELALIGNQIASLKTDRTRIGAQMVPIQTQLFDIQQQVLTSNQLPNIAIQAQARALNLSLAALGKQAFVIDRNILALQNRAAVLMGKGQQEAQTLAERDAMVQKTAKNAKVIERKIKIQQAAPPKASTAALTSQMTSLSTYLPFPYEQERKRVLGWFEKESEK